MLVGARPPLIAFNVELEPPATLEDARRIAAVIREGGPEGLTGVRAIGLWLEHRGRRAGLDERRGSPRDAARGCSSRRSPGTRAGQRAELVGLAPRAAFEGFPETSRSATSGCSRTRWRTPAN